MNEESSSLGNIGHPHAGNLRKQLIRIPQHQFFEILLFFRFIQSSIAVAGKILYGKRNLFFQPGQQSFAHSGAHQTDKISLRRFFLLGKGGAEPLKIKVLTRKISIFLCKIYELIPKLKLGASVVAVGQIERTRVRQVCIYRYNLTSSSLQLFQKSLYSGYHLPFLDIAPVTSVVVDD